MPNVKVVHRRQLWTEAGGRHDYIHKMWEIFLDFLGDISGSFDHSHFLTRTTVPIFDLNQTGACRTRHRTRRARIEPLT